MAQVNNPITRNKHQLRRLADMLNRKGDTMENTTTRPTADQLNAHLANGGVVQVTTCTKSWIYTSKHVGAFIELRDGALAVKRGKSSDRLSMGNLLLVGIRLGRVV
jgi:hypothetical protein